MYILSNKQFKELTDNVVSLQKQVSELGSLTVKLTMKMDAVEEVFGIEEEKTFISSNWYCPPYRLKRWEEFLKTLGYEYKQETIQKEGWVKIKK